jgi:glutamate--cysteine ligase
MSKPLISGEGVTLLSRPLKDTTRADLAQLFLGAVKKPSDWMIGMEVELFGVHTDTRRPIAYQTVKRVLEVLAERNDLSPEHEQSGALIGLRGGGALVSIEPGGQVEIATKPHKTMKALSKDIARWFNAIRDAGKAEGVSFWALGYHPFDDRDTMPKMPKARYDVMRSYLASRGARALDMMHCTASVQCAVDFSSERNMVDKLRTAVRVSPFLTALVAASPFANGKPNGFKTLRYQVWLETDDERSGIWPEMLDEEGLTYDRYVERALAVPPFFFMRNGQHRAPADRRPFSYWMQYGFEGTPVTVGDLIDHLTTFFPEVRPKSYLELRGADCLRPYEAGAVAAFWRGLLDDEAARREADDRLKRMGYAELKALQPEVARLGLEAESAIGPVAEIVEWLVKLSHQRLLSSPTDCAECVTPLIERAEARQAPADEMLATARASTVEDAVDAFAL